MSIKQLLKKIWFKISPVYRQTNYLLQNTERIENEQRSAAERLARVESAESSIAEIKRRQDELSQKYDGFGTAIAEQIQELKNELHSEMNCLQALNEILQLPDAYTHTHTARAEEDYIRMQQSVYNNPDIPSEDIVGNYGWHEEFPYETFLLYRNGDIRKPIFESTSDKVALDFACGPGRMVSRMRRLFKEVDGCDVSERLIKEAKERVPEANFYVTNGNDLGDVPLGHYDFIYCTISMQHIASRKIRLEIIRSMFSALKPSGKITLQLAYNPNFPYVAESKRMQINDCEVRFFTKIPMADWDSDDFDATTTNGGYDVGIGERNLERVKADFSGIFQNVSVWFGNVSNYYKNLDGNRHCNYWATDWIFIHGEKPL